MKILKSLNNKGMTAVEVLVCFILVVIITTALYTMVNVYKNKQEIEATKERVVTYKNLLTKEINDDLIKDGVVSATVEPYTATSKEYKVTMNMRNGETKCLKVWKNASCNSFMNNSDYTSSDRMSPSGTENLCPEATDTDEEFYISYGSCGSETKYRLPDLGSSLNFNGKKIYDFRINNVDIEIKDSILSIYIGFYHPELLTRYAIDIVCPLNF